MDVTAGSTARSRAITALIVGYFVVIAYATITNDPLAATVAELGFGVIAIAVGAMLYGQRREPRSVLAVAAGCLVAGGVFTFGAVVTRSAALNALSSLLVFLGVGCYVYALWRAN
ncbi:hypothetical protein [Natrinema ejinorense]|uniref:Uncharacterized protein n=1 Tax=Natrinema ejinorense TaxID=373386 RepID=A0A2A5QZT8_9EURY|nr:hypothetical protein [Natrinema ejinorense]PCR92322.1 hypothetical protein CP557_18400 [Natrinema ejinorense]